MLHSNRLQDLIAHAKAYGFVYPSSQIYEGLQAVYDYGPYGAELRHNLKTYWWQSMTYLHHNIVGLDAAIFMHPTTWKASGHVDSFTDPMIDNKDSQKRYRADVLLEEKAAFYEQQGEITKAKNLLKQAGQLFTADDLEGIYDLIKAEEIICPISKTANWTKVRHFNLMFETETGALSEDSHTVYLRPETAQGIFVNFLNIQKSTRQKIPFGIAQIGKAFRNEIVARQFIFRMREFEQMEMQFFIPPGTELEWYAHWKETRYQWHRGLGIAAQNLRFHDHEKLAHYANAACDIEYAFPFGFKEVEGIHSRTDFDLSQHQKYSKKKQQYFDENLKKSYIPFVIETSIGLDRLFLMVFNAAYREETAPKKRIYLKFHPALAPVKAAILPLVRKDGLPDKARRIYDNLKTHFALAYDEQATVGKRYARQDLIGTPYCIALDYQSLEDDTVTIRAISSRQQERVAVSQLKSWLEERVSINTMLR